MLDHEPCETCQYIIKENSGHHEVGLIAMCDESGVRVVCRTCKWTEDFHAPKDRFDFPAFFSMIDDVAEVHSVKFLHLHDEEAEEEVEEEWVKVSLWQRIVAASNILRTKYIDLSQL